ncbi:DUF4167 domain-containing protein [Parvularcula lutaonensis]|uniref:DUF4167 domain-containing protein n=1 Tax=Parvularcula lutaonensis TaxID=491923 RepID=A0ABV7M8Z0_9PROT|nr:DUF4167 domain-containing protein [Parvularcula lutaonensis]GGY40940.1 hypothetical protein GCM10007148_06890 [Parvularcula lutaonensis]
MRGATNHTQQQDKDHTLMAQYSKRGRNSNRRRQGGNNNPNRSMDSQGPEVKIRGTAAQIYDKYQALARDAFSSGDRIRGESLMQHAEHYYRLMKSMQPEKKEDKKQDDQENAEQHSSEAQVDAKTEGSEEKKPDDSPAKENAEASGDDSDDGKPRRRRRRRRSSDENDAQADGSSPEEQKKPALQLEEAPAE